MEKIGQHLPQLTPSRSGSNSLVSSETRVRNCSPETAVDLTTILIGCYRKGECEDPEVFVTAAASVLARYPEDVARFVTDPHSGIAGKLKWFPTIYEIREACDIENAKRQLAAERDASLREQFAERDRMAAMTPAEKRKEFIAGWRARMDEHFANLAAADQTIALADLDPRKLVGVHKERVQEAVEAKLSRLTDEYRKNPVALSARALASLGLSGEGG